MIFINAKRKIKPVHTLSNIPYTYLIGWSHLNTWYYGRRTSKDCHPDDFWITYFTSSRHVSEFRKNHGEPDVVSIRQVFTDEDSMVRITRCMRWEHTFLTRIGAVEKENWLNKHDAGNCFGGPAAARLSHTPEVNVKRHNTRMQNEKPYNTPETINKQKLTRQNNSSWRLSVDKMVATRLERGVNSNAIKVICEHCGKSVGKPNYARHHGERCKHRPEA